MEIDDLNGKRTTDLSYLISLCGEDDDFKIEMIETFLKNTPPLINDMKNYIFDSDWKKIGDIAHKMKPSFQFMGIHTAKELILNIERLGRQMEDVSSIPTMVQELELICNQAFSELEMELTVN